jgi:tRNA (guanine-N7-)-methyltransferase
VSEAPDRDGVRHPRHVRSFVRRAGRTTERQQRALDSLWPRYGVEAPAPDAPLPADHWETVFGRGGPLTLEIGFGMGTSLLQMAAAEPERRFVGVEVHPPGIGALMAGLEEQGLDNVRVLEADAAAILEAAFAPGSLDRVQVFFPDPWPKKRHHKRRLVQAPFLERLATRVAPGGRLMLATDWVPYAEWMLEAVAAAPSWRSIAPDGGFVPRPAERPETRFEARGLKRGHEVRDLVLERV